MMTETTPLTARITTASLTEIKETVKKLNRRAVKLNLPEIVLSTKPSDPLVVFRNPSRKVVMEMTDDRYGTYSASAQYSVTIVETVEITICGESPKFDGWRLIATLEPTGDGEGGFVNLMKSVIGENVENQYRNDVGRCDHCNKSRRRKETFVVEHDNGTQKVVGRNCIADFLGHKDVNALVNYAAALAEMANSLNDFEAFDVVEDGESYSFGGSAPLASPLERFVDLSVRACRVYGWVSATRAGWDGAGSTKSIVLNHVERPRLMSATEERAWEEQHAALMEADIDTRASDIIEWAKSIDKDDDSEYLFNLRTIAHVGYVSTSTAGYAASMYVAYQNAMEREIERKKFEARKPSNWLGSEGDKLELTVTVERIINNDGDWGVVGIHKMTDTEGNDLVWFASGSNWLNSENATAYKIRGTVKKHSEFKGRRQTQLTRVKILEEIERPANA